MTCEQYYAIAVYAAGMNKTANKKPWFAQIWEHSNIIYTTKTSAYRVIYLYIYTYTKCRILENHTHILLLPYL